MSYQRTGKYAKITPGEMGVDGNVTTKTAIDELHAALAKMQKESRQAVQHWLSRMKTDGRRRIACRKSA